jgi:translation initiation factor eIF-2B subunit delta
VNGWNHHKRGRVLSVRPTIMTDETRQDKGREQASSAPDESDDKNKKEKRRPDGLVIPDPKPKLSKAERRAIQEAQRAAKAGGGGKPGGGGGGAPIKAAESKPKPAGSEASSPKSKSAAPATTSSASGVATSSKSKDPSSTAPAAGARTISAIPMVSHLQPPLDESSLADLFSVGGSALTAPSHPHLHPAVVRLGYDYAAGHVRGGNARCRAMLECFCQVIRDFRGPASEATATTSIVDWRTAIDQQVLKPSFSFWSGKCRPHSVSMGNAITFLKAAVAAASRDLSLQELQSQLVDTIKAYRQERIDLATTAIAECLLNAPVSSSSSNYKSYKSSSTPTRLLSENDVVLVYGHSEAISLALRQTTLGADGGDGDGGSADIANRPKAFARVVVVDSRPLWEGRAMLQSLRSAGVDCSYVALNSISYVMPDVTKVLLGASALMSDGSVLGRSGSAAVALVAHSHRVPVLVCAETYKISNRVQLESVTTNELGGGGGVPHANKENDTRFKRLHLMYDLTPAQFVSGIVTELGIVPPTSVAVLLREMNPHDVTRK